MQVFTQVGIIVGYKVKELLRQISSMIDRLRDNKLVIMYANQVCRNSTNCHH